MSFTRFNAERFLSKQGLLSSAIFLFTLVFGFLLGYCTHTKKMSEEILEAEKIPFGLSRRNSVSTRHLASMQNDGIALQALAEHQFSCNAVKAFEELTLLHRKRKELEDRNRKGEANLARKATVARKFTAASAAEGAFRKCTNSMMPELLSLWDAKLERGELDIHGWNDSKENQIGGITFATLEATADLPD